MAIKLQRVKPGDPIRADQWNQLIDSIERLLNMLAGAGLNMSSFGGILTLSANPRGELFGWAMLTEPLTSGGKADATPLRQLAVPDDASLDGRLREVDDPETIEVRDVRLEGSDEAGIESGEELPSGTIVMYAVDPKTGYRNVIYANACAE